MVKGSCLCGAVRFTVTGDLPAPTACHCTKCRKHTGHFEAGTDVPRDRVKIDGASTLTWFRSSDRARRGFCSVCGSSLFFEPDRAGWIGINMGAFDTPTGTKLAAHVFVGAKGDYYDITDDLPQYRAVPGT